MVIAKHLFLLAFLGENQNEGFGEILGLTIWDAWVLCYICLVYYRIGSLEYAENKRKMLLFVYYRIGSLEYYWHCAKNAAGVYYRIGSLES